LIGGIESAYYYLSFCVKGRENVKRALEVAATGHHNLIMTGPPGSCKTILAKRLSAIMPPLTLEEALETTRIHSVAGGIDDHTDLMTRRPFRSPHPAISDVVVINYVMESLISPSPDILVFKQHLIVCNNSVSCQLWLPLTDILTSYR
jgi:magnesium chelatase family protein